MHQTAYWIIRVITFRAMQHIRPRYIQVSMDGQTDGQRTLAIPRFGQRASRGKCDSWLRSLQVYVKPVLEWVSEFAVRTYPTTDTWFNMHVLNPRSDRIDCTVVCFFTRVAAARTWNSLPSEVTSSQCLRTIRTKLKTHLFSVSFP